jgi:hypothetical protein
MRPWDEKAKPYRAAAEAAFNAFQANRTPENDTALAEARAAWFEYQRTEIEVGYSPKRIHFMEPGKRERREALCGAMIEARSIMTYKAWRNAIPNPRRLMCEKCMNHPKAVEQNGDY